MVSAGICVRGVCFKKINGDKVRRPIDECFRSALELRACLYRFACPDAVFAHDFVFDSHRIEGDFHVGRLLHVG